jgi:uncharacterized protein (DUF1800 family)
MTATWDRRRASHLYLRAGFGASPEELDLAVSLGREGAISRLVDYDSISTADLDAYLDTFGFDLESDADAPFDRFLNLRRWWFLRMQYTPRPLEEKMVLFWHNHFATSIDKVGSIRLMYAQNRIFRNLGMGRFETLLLEVSRDPAMLIWLDNASNVKQSPNENFAREVMELFTMGVNRYTQRDVTESARAFTGWTIDPEHGNRFAFNRDFHDDGPKMFLGNRGFFAGEDIIRILAARPETASFITAKLAGYFLGAEPSPALAQRLIELYLSSSGDLREIVREILRSDDFDAKADAPDQLKSPVELIVGARRALGVFDDPAGYVQWPELMGHALFRPPNVGGWKGGRTWLHTGAYLIRINIAFWIVTQTSRWGDVFRWDISRFFEGRAFASAEEVIDFLLDRFNVVAPADSLRSVLRNHFALSDPFVWNAGSYSYFARGALYVLMASPEYQLQ